MERSKNPMLMAKGKQVVPGKHRPKHPTQPTMVRHRIRRKTSLLRTTRHRIVQLASPAHHAEFMQPRLPLSVAGSVAFVGAKAFDRETQDVLWKRGLTSVERPVPARETLLVVWPVHCARRERL